MLIRIWSTEVDATLIDEYEAFAKTESRLMFQNQPGCLGVLFLRNSNKCEVISFWNDAESIEALSTSQSYLKTVGDIKSRGFLGEKQEIKVFELHGGFLDRRVTDDVQRSG